MSVDNVLRLATFTAAAGFSGMTAIRFEVTDAQGARGVDTGDGRISLQDFFLLAEKQGLSDTHLNWNPVFDLDGDSKVDLEDFFRFADIFIANQRSTASP